MLSSSLAATPHLGVLVLLLATACCALQTSSAQQLEIAPPTLTSASAILYSCSLARREKRSLHAGADEFQTSRASAPHSPIGMTLAQQLVLVIRSELKDTGENHLSSVWRSFDPPASAPQPELRCSFNGTTLALSAEQPETLFADYVPMRFTPLATRPQSTFTSWLDVLGVQKHFALYASDVEDAMFSALELDVAAFEATAPQGAQVPLDVLNHCTVHVATQSAPLSVLASIPTNVLYVDEPPSRISRSTVPSLLELDAAMTPTDIVEKPVPEAPALPVDEDKKEENLVIDDADLHESSAAESRPTRLRFKSFPRKGDKESAKKGDEPEILARMRFHTLPDWMSSYQPDEVRTAVGAGFTVENPFESTAADVRSSIILTSAGMVIDAIVAGALGDVIKEVEEWWGFETAREASTMIASEMVFEDRATGKRKLLALNPSGTPKMAEGLIKALIPAISNDITARITTAYSDMLSDTLAASIHSTFIGSTSSSITQAVDKAVSKGVIQNLRRTVPHMLTRVLPGVLLKPVVDTLKQTMTRSLTHILAPTLSMTLAHTAPEHLACGYCRSNGTYCHFCGGYKDQIKEKVYAADYYGSYYADYYVDQTYPSDGLGEGEGT